MRAAAWARAALLALLGGEAGCAAAGARSAPAPVSRPASAPAASASLASPAPSPCREGWGLRAEELAETAADEAVALLRRCLRAKGGRPAAWRLLAALEQDGGELERARRTLLRAVASHPRDAFSWAALGRIEAGAGRGESALGAFERAHRLRPEHEGLALERLRALDRFGSASERRGARIAPLLAEADGRAELGDVEGALLTLEAAQVVIDGDGPLEARVELRRALLHLGSGEPDAGLAAARRGLLALGEGTDEPQLRAELHTTEAEARLARGEPEAAVLAARAARSYVPEHPLACTNLGLALLRLGDRAGAESALVAALEGGLASRLDRASFVGLDGVRALLDASAALRSATEAAFGGARASAP